MGNERKKCRAVIKACDNILEKHPCHPGKHSFAIQTIETMAFKALNLSVQTLTKHAFETINEALQKNLSNFMCWQVYGIL